MFFASIGESVGLKVWGWLIGAILLTAGAVFLAYRFYCVVVRLKARNLGIFRDDRRDNDFR
jgi:hypothetical protein